MSVFFSFAQTGEDVVAYTERMQAVCSEAERQGIKHYCILNDQVAQKLQGEKQKLSRAMHQLQQYDCVIAIVSSPRRSEGMLIEVGAALAYGKPVYCLLHESAVGQMYLPSLCQQVVVWRETDSLLAQLETLLDSMRYLDLASQQKHPR